MSSFTLIELLLVIGLIGLLISLSLPAYSNAKNQAQRVACRVTIKSYAMRYSEQGRLVIEIPQEANCLDCHQLRP